MGGRYSMTATPGRRRNPRRRQKSPVLSATGRHGALVSGVDRRDPLFVARRRSWQAPGSLGIDEHLPTGGEDRPRRFDDLLKRLTALGPVDRDLPGDDQVEAEQRDVGELALEDDREVGRIFEQREGLEKRLMLGRDQHRALGDILDPAIFDLEPADRLEKPDGHGPPQFGQAEDAASPAENRGQAQDHQRHERQVK